VCGIAGFVGRGRNDQLESALMSMRHRGPDASGLFEIRHGEFDVGFGHVRLSILDLTDSANQPFQSSDGQYVLIFNGEIYNHNALRNELISLGRTFRTRSDTEVILAAYESWGVAFLAKLDGMFAFALMDRFRGKILFCRDPMGIKPLYLMGDICGTGLFFASEIRGLRALSGDKLKCDSTVFAEFLLNGFLYEPRTGYLGVQKLFPGNAIELDLNSGKSRQWAYYDPLETSNSKSLDSLLRESVSLQSLADVKVGIFFSGGIDSAALAAASEQPLIGLHAVFPSELETSSTDTTYARQVALALKLKVEEMVHSASPMNPDEIISEFRAVAKGTEEPISDYTYAASEMISKMARARGFKVMLSGMGGDELFGGYPRYLPVLYSRYLRMLKLFMPNLLQSIIQRIPAFAKKADRFARFISEPDFGMAYTNLIGYFGASEVNEMLGNSDGIDLFRGRLSALLNKVQGLSPLKKAMYLDRYGFLAHNLTVTDKSSMAKSVEVRVPLMSCDLAAFGFNSSDSALIFCRKTKRPLRQFVSHFLQSNLVHRPKYGFNPPLDDKIKILGARRIEKMLTGSVISGLINSNFVRGIIREHFDGKANHTYRLWQLLYFSLWLEEADS
jgi:asparagine synthase (glutamine-hydrolysing)